MSLLLCHFEPQSNCSIISSLLQDLNIGIALWLAASGDGCLQDETGNDDTCVSVKYKSAARILLVGAGADEQCAGYGRHRTKYRNGR